MTLSLRYAVAVPRLAIDGTHYWLVLARFADYFNAELFMQGSALKSAKILDIV